MTNFISVQLKKASEVDLAKPLCKFIQQSYPVGDAQAEHCRAAEELSKLRKSALGRPLDKHDACLDTLLRYGTARPASVRPPAGLGAGLGAWEGWGRRRKRRKKKRRGRRKRRLPHRLPLSSASSVPVTLGSM